MIASMTSMRTACLEAYPHICFWQQHVLQHGLRVMQYHIMVQAETLSHDVEDKSQSVGEPCVLATKPCCVRETY